MRAALMMTVVPMILGLSGWKGIDWWAARESTETTENAYVAGDIVQVSPRVEGYVTSISVADNQPVAAGTVLATLDDTALRAAAQEQQASLRLARSSLETVDRKIQLQTSRIAERDAEVHAARAEHHRAQLMFRRYQDLVSDKIIGTQEMDDARATLEKATAEVARLEAARESERSELQVNISSRMEAVANVDAAVARLVAAEDRLSRAVIRAPISGTIGDRAIRLGQYVKPGNQLLAIVPHDSYVVANFKETQLAEMAVGQIVDITVDAYPDRLLHGQIDSFAPASGSEFSLLPEENATGNFTKVVRRIPVRIAIEEKDAQDLLRVGMSAEVTVHLNESESAKGWRKFLDDLLPGIEAQARS